jgi:hypothetical protein
MQCAAHQFEIPHIALAAHGHEEDNREHALGGTADEADLF